MTPFKWHLSNDTEVNDLMTLTLTFKLKIAFWTLLPPGAKCFTNTPWFFIVYLTVQRIPFNNTSVNYIWHFDGHIGRQITPIHHLTARNYLQYRRHSPNREVLLIGRQFFLWFRRLSLHREDRFSSEKTKRWCALQFVFAHFTTVIFRWRLKKDGDKLSRFLIGAPRICRANAWKKQHLLPIGRICMRYFWQW